MAECKIHTCNLGKVEEEYHKYAINETSFIHEHLTTLYFIAKEFKCHSILELGTSIGESTTTFHQAVREIGGHLTTVDIDQKLKGDDWMDCIKADITDPNFTYNRKLDILFVDSKHSREQVKLELEKFGHLVNTGGFIILHDTTHPLYMEINEAISEYFDDSWTKYSWFNNNGLTVMRRN